jgi:hypothetical protein
MVDPANAGSLKGKSGVTGCEICESGAIPVAVSSFVVRCPGAKGRFIKVHVCSIYIPLSNEINDGKVLNREQARRPARIIIHSWLSGEKHGM